MPAAYDTYDYPAYWSGREYEHESEVRAIKRFLNKIPRINKAVDVGAGYGRLTSSYLYRCRKVTLTDPSAKLLKIARANYIGNKVICMQTKVENLPKKFLSSKYDLAIMTRVLHHIDNINRAFAAVNRILADRGYFILEFANKNHFKALFKALIKGNFTFPIDIFPHDVRCRKNKRLNTLPFNNYHPDLIVRYLEENNFEVLDRISVSNFRSIWFKEFIPKEFLLWLDEKLGHVLSSLHFGPSIFILARKK